MADASTDAAVLSVRDLRTTVRLGGHDVAGVNGVSFDLRRGRTLGLVGESGCGKSMTALSILRLLPEPVVRVTSGQVLFGDRDLVRASESDLCALRGRHVAMIFQEPSSALNPVLTIGAQVSEPLRIHLGLPKAEAQARAVELLKKVGIPAPEERVHAYPHQLSGGMKQRAMIAMALACGPSVLIADEPTTALDVTVQAQILDLLKRLGREEGMAILLITHDLGVVAETCDDVAVMYAGRIVEQGPTQTLLSRPAHPYTVGLLRAVPRIDDDRTSGRLYEIPGVVPPLNQMPDGCAFADRCTRVQATCRAAVPPLSSVVPESSEHRARCLYPYLEGETR